MEGMIGEDLRLLRRVPMIEVICSPGIRLNRSHQ